MKMRSLPITLGAVVNVINYPVIVYYEHGIAFISGARKTAITFPRMAILLFKRIYSRPRFNDVLFILYNFALDIFMKKYKVKACFVNERLPIQLINRYS